MICPSAAKTTMDETGADLEFSRKAAWNKCFSLFKRKLKLELKTLKKIGKFLMRSDA